MVAQIEGSVPIEDLAVPLPATWTRASGWVADVGSMMRRYRAVAAGRPVFAYGMYDVRRGGSWRPVYCQEHRRREIVPMGNYDLDLQHWYQAGLHPRFSVIAALIDLGVRYFELERMTGGWRRRSSVIVGALRAAKSDREAFLRLMRPRINVTLYARGRRYRVTPSFKARYKAKRFRTRDFLGEVNQELRRLMLGRGVAIPAVIKTMKVVHASTEGKLLEARDADQSRYLYVTCPSTKQEYLLGVPHSAGWGAGGNHVISTVAAARRWTFDLPKEAVFAEET